MPQLAGGGSSRIGWTNDDVAQVLDDTAAIKVTTESLLDKQTLHTNVTVWFYFVFVMMAGYVLARHFTPSEREITR